MPRIEQKHLGIPAAISSAVYSYVYEPETLRFEVRFRKEDGTGALSVTQWRGVSRETFDEFQDAGSKGSYLSRFVIGKYESESFEVEAPAPHDAREYWESLYAAKHRTLPNLSTPSPGFLMNPNPPEVAL